MADEQKSPAVAAAEAKLMDLEKYRIDNAHALTALRAAEQTADPDKIAAAQKALSDAKAAEAEANIQPDQVAQASQDVLDARGEGHTELNILPPDHGIRTVDADSALADALGRRKSPAVIEKLQAELADAQKADAAEKAAHATAAHERTLASLKGDATP